MKITVLKPKAPEYESVEIREPVYADIRRAIETSGLTIGQIGITSLPTLIAHLIHECATFDGKRIPIEEIEGLPVSFFLDVMQSLDLQSEPLEAIKASLGNMPQESPQV